MESNAVATAATANQDLPPAKSRRARLYTRKLTWINKDANNLSDRSRLETQAIRSHIQGAFRPWDKLHSVKCRPRGPASKRDPISTSEHGGTVHHFPNVAIAGVGRLPVSNDKDRSKSNCEFLTSVESSDFGGGMTRSQPQSIWPQTPRSTDHSLLTQIGNGNHDPFSSACVSIDAFHHDALMFLGSRMMNAVWPSLRNNTSRISATTTWLADCHNSIQDKAYLHGLFATAFVLKSRFVARDSVTGKKLRVQAYTYIGKCLKQVRTDLGVRRPDEQMISAIWSIVSLYLLDGNVKTSRIHMLNLKKMIDGMGGIDALPEMIRCKVLSWDIAIANAVNLPTVFLPSVWTPPSFETLQITLEDRTIYGQAEVQVSSQRQRPLHHAVPSRLREHFMQRREVIAVRSLADTLPTHDESVTVLDHWHYQWLGSLESAHHQLYSKIRCELLQVSVQPISFELCMCLASRFLHRFVCRSNLDTAGCMQYAVFKDQLQYVVNRLDVRVDTSVQTAFLWMFFVGACAEEMHNRRLLPDRCRFWFTLNFLDNAVDLGLTVPHKMSVVLGQFVYNEIHFRGILDSLLNRLGQGLSHDVELLQWQCAGLDFAERVARHTDLETVPGHMPLLSPNCISPIFS